MTKLTEVSIYKKLLYGLCYGQISYRFLTHLLHITQDGTKALCLKLFPSIGLRPARASCTLTTLCQNSYKKFNYTSIFIPLLEVDFLSNREQLYIYSYFIRKITTQL